jgi:hypothetical protein
VAAINQLQRGHDRLLFDSIEKHRCRARPAEQAYQAHIAEHDCVLWEDDLANVSTSFGATEASLIMPADIAEPIRKSSGRVILCWRREREENR